MGQFSRSYRGEENGEVEVTGFGPEPLSPHQRVKELKPVTDEPLEIWFTMGPFKRAINVEYAAS